MANRNFNRVQALDKEIKFLYGQALVTDTTGAVTLNESLSAGIKSFVYVAQGVYDITLGVPGGDSDKYPAVKFFEAITTSTPPASTISTYGGALWTLSGNTVSTDGILTAYGLNVSGAGAAFRAGDTVKFHIVLKNSNQPGVGVS